MTEEIKLNVNERINRGNEKGGKARNEKRNRRLKADQGPADVIESLEMQLDRKAPALIFFTKLERLVLCLVLWSIQASEPFKYC